MKTSKFKLTPISGTQNRIFIKPIKEEKVSQGGIIIVEAADKKPTEGIIIAISERDSNGKEPNVMVGDHVYFSEYVAAVESEYEGEKFLVMKEADLFAKLNK